MQTLSYGFKKPETNDKGPTVFPALQDDIQQINDHDHDGANSKKLTSASIDSIPQNLIAADWVDLGGGNFHQQVTLLPGYAYDTVTLNFRDTATGAYVYPSVVRVSSTQMDITTNDPSDMTIIYGV